MISIGELMSKFGELYAAGSYHEALALIQRETPNLPENHAMLLCFEAAMFARTGDTARALSTFRTALNSGYWYHEGGLRGDPDFVSLQNEPEFETIVAENAHRRHDALSAIKPFFQILEKPDTPPSAPLLITLHGNFGSAGGYAAHWQSAVEKGWRVALPQSTQAAWFSNAYDWADIDLGLQELDDHYHSLITSPAAPACIVIAGFSRGALVAQRAILTKRIHVNGFLWLEGVPDPDFTQLVLTHKPYDFRAFFAFGRSQDFAKSAGSFAQTLREAGVVCELEILNSDHHEIPASFPHTLERALAFLCP